MKTDARPTTKATPSMPASGNGHAAETKAPLPNHPLASVLGSFADDPAVLDAIMAGVEKYRRQMEAEGLQTISAWE